LPQAKSIKMIAPKKKRSFALPLEKESGVGSRRVEKQRRAPKKNRTKKCLNEKNECVFHRNPNLPVRSWAKKNPSLKREGIV
jgi:hypothetical protein